MQLFFICVVIVNVLALDAVESGRSRLSFYDANSDKDLGHSSGDDIYFANAHNISTIAEKGSGEAEFASGVKPLDDASGDFGPTHPNTDSEGSGEPPIEFIATGVPEESTLPPKEPIEITDESEPEEFTGSTTPFDINNMETGSPEGSTKEPHMPKPNPKPHPGGNETMTGSNESPYPTGFTDDFSGSSDFPTESIAPEHWRSTTTRKIDFTISQKMDENSPGYKQLLHMLEDLGTRRKEDTAGSNQTEFYIQRASMLMDTIDASITNTALANITAAQEYIKGLLSDASVTVRQGYNQIVSLTSTPSFYYIPKRQRYLMVNKIITDMGDSGEQELWSLNQQAKTFCRKSNVDTPPYSLGNIVGNKLGNGAIISK